MNDLELKKTLEVALFGIYNSDEISMLIRHHPKVKEVLRYIENIVMCPNCGIPVFRSTLNSQNKSGQCSNCRQKHSDYKHGKCDRCQREDMHIVTRKNGVAVCATCYQRNRRNDTSKHQACSKCGKMKFVARHTEGGEPLCVSCYGKLWKTRQLPHR